jgi:hypothetical protein
MRIGNDDITLSGTSMAVDITSDPIWLGHIANYSIQIVFTGTPDGVFKLQLSNDEGNPSAAKEADRDFGIVNWTSIGGSSQIISAAGDLSYQVENAGYRWVRLVWEATSAGSGTPTITSCRFNVKGI